MANKYNINFFKDIFFFFGSIPSSSLNLLDNFKIINYGGSILPRIYLDPNNSQNLEQIIYSPIEDINYNIFKNQSDNNISESNKDIEIQISKIEKDTEIINSMENNEVNNKKCEIINYIEKKDINKKRYNDSTLQNLEQLNNYIKNKKNFELLPPKTIISIINDNNNIENINNNNETINNIILNNVNLLSNYNYIINNKVSINKDKDLTPTIINQINNQTIFNFNFNIYTNVKEIFSTKNNITKPSSDLPRINISKPLFEISSESNITNGKNKNKKRGRKVLKVNKNNRIHKASDDDNLLRKIQVHFISFAINFVNDVIKTLINIKFPPQFKNLDYTIKKTVNHKFVEELKSKNIAQILQMSVSPKMKIHGEIVNRKIYEKVCHICPFMINFLNKNYVDFFKEYYYNNNNTIFQENGKIIQLSIKTKTFKNLIEKNENLKDKLKYIAIRYFINSPKNNKIIHHKDSKS